jgi:integral membrane protein (TIGR00529 family)
MSFVNYWFRHLWEYWWPLYPGVLLTTNLAAVDLWTFVGTLFPMSLVAAAAGYLPLRRMMPARRPGAAPAATARPRVRPFVRELIPVLIAIVPGIALGSLLEAALTGPAATVSKELGLIVALCAAIGWVWRTNRLPAGRRRGIVLRRETLAMIYMVAAILVFKGVLLDSRAVEAVSAELMDWQVPLVAIAVVLPLIVGLVVGITIAFVGSAFPILISLIAAYQATDQTLAYLMLAMTGGFVGVLLSPLHLCLVLSNQYFRADPVSVYRLLWRPCLALILAAVGYFYLLA